MDLTKWKEWSPRIARYGIAMVFLVFGIWQWVDPTSWLGYLPVHGIFGLSDTTLIYLNGTFDFVLGLFLALGLLTRLVAIVAALHLFGIAVTAGGDVGVRDAALGIVALSVFLHGADAWSVDKKIDWNWLQ